MGLSLTKKKRTAADAWIESLDPLNGMSIAQARNVHNAARKHGSPLLQKMFSEIEESDPVLMTCVERRQSALAGLGWRTVANASARDQTLAEEQRAALEEFANGVGNLDDAIEHLGLGFFRGFSVCQPIWDGNGVRHIELLDSWNFLKGDDGGLLWNPECSMDPARCVPITPEARAMVFRRRRAIDWPALNIYIRKYIGERDWGRFLERYGIPPVDVVMAPNTTNAQRDDYLESAEAARDGRPAAWPAGSQISRAEGSRGQDPFSAYLEHQEKLVVLMATGGTLTSLAQADTGSLAGGAQMDVWTQIVARDGVAISAALHRDLFAPFLREAFPRWPVSARLELGREDEPTAEEAADMAVKLRGAGYRVDQSQLEEATGYKLERAEDGAPEQLKGSEVERWRSPGQSNSSAVRLFNSSTFQPGNGAETRLAAAMQRDLRPVGKAIAAALKKRDWGALRKKLGGMLPECGTESAEVIEEAVREDGEEAQKNKKDGETEAVANSECRAKDPAHCPTHGVPVGKKEKPKTPTVGSRNPDAPEVQKAQIAKAKEAFAKCLETHEDVVDAFQRGDIGNIDVRWGKERKGLRHLVERRDGYAKAHPGELDGRQTLEKIAETVVRGEITEVTRKSGHNTVAIEHEGFRALLTKDDEGGNHWILSGYEISDEARGYRKKARQG